MAMRSLALPAHREIGRSGHWPSLGGAATFRLLLHDENPWVWARNLKQSIGTDRCIFRSPRGVAMHEGSFLRSHQSRGLIYASAASRAVCCFPSAKQTGSIIDQGVPSSLTLLNHKERGGEVAEIEWHYGQPLTAPSS
jgi:hypothetical protein